MINPGRLIGDVDQPARCADPARKPVRPRYSPTRSRPPVPSTTSNPSALSPTNRYAPDAATPTAWPRVAEAPVKAGARGIGTGPAGGARRGCWRRRPPSPAATSPSTGCSKSYPPTATGDSGERHVDHLHARPDPDDKVTVARRQRGRRAGDRDGADPRLAAIASAPRRLRRPLRRPRRSSRPRRLRRKSFFMSPGHAASTGTSCSRVTGAWYRTAACRRRSSPPPARAGPSPGPARPRRRGPGDASRARP